MTEKENSIEEKIVENTNIGEYLKEKSEKIKTLSIFLHDSPDPDAMASGLALSALGEKYGYKSNIYYGGEVTYTKNKAMIQILGINMIKIDDLKEDKESLSSHKDYIKDSIICLADTCSWKDGNCRGPAALFDANDGIIPHIIIDHHGQSPLGNDIIINKSYGSCSTILTEILIKEEIIPDKILGTALYYGLMSDTDDMNRVEIIKEEDQDIHNYLKDLIDFQYYLRIVNCKKPKILMSLEGLAKHVFLKERGNCTVSGIGFIKTGHSGTVSEIADNILSTYQEVENIIVIAITDDGVGKEKRIRASLRNSGDILDSDDFMKKIFGKKFAGGRKGAAAANKPVDEVLEQIIDMAAQSENSEESLMEIFQKVFALYADKILNEIQVST